MRHPDTFTLLDDCSRHVRPFSLAVCKFSDFIRLVMRIIGAVLAATLVSCTATSGLTADEHARIERPNPELQERLNALAPSAIKWLNQVAAEMSVGARALTAQEQAMAREVGVSNTAAVRVVLVDEMPLPREEPLQSMAIKLGYGNKAIAGGCIGSLVWLNKRHADNRALLAHELVHVAQQERMPQVQYFMRYMTELLVVGYARSPLEVEANSVMGRYRDVPQNRW